MVAPSSKAFNNSNHGWRPTRETKKRKDLNGVVDENRRKSRRVEGVTDCDYLWYLKSKEPDELAKHLKQTSEDEDNDDVDDSDWDPQYSMFLEALVEDGKSYKLNVSENGQDPLFLIYEAQEYLGEEGSSLSQRRGHVGKRQEKAGAGNDLWNNHAIERGEYLENLRSFREKERKAAPPYRYSEQKNNPKPTEVIWEVSDMDTSLEHSENLSSPQEKDKKTRSTNRCSRRKNNLDNNEVIWEATDTNTWGENSEKMSSLQEKEKKASFTNRKSSQMNYQNHSEAVQKASGTDNCYGIFLNGLRTGGTAGVFVYNGEQVIYEDKSESSDDSDIVVWDGATCNNIPLTPKPDESFRKKVTKILSRPFDQHEYKRLLKDAEEGKPVGRNVELRTRSVTSVVDGTCKSYLDYHYDLKRRLTAANGERGKVLNLLRGFFCWLKHVPNDDGVFKPWMDAECLAILPASR